MRPRCGNHSIKNGHAIALAGDAEEKYRKLMAGDLSDFNGDYSRADLALCNFLARKNNNNFFKIDEAWLASPLYRPKLERTDYRSATILKAVKGEAVVEDGDEDVIEDDGIDEYVVESAGDGHEGWFPLGDISLVGGSSGSGKTYWVMTVLEKVRQGAEVWGHKAIARDYSGCLCTTRREGNEADTERARPVGRCERAGYPAHAKTASAQAR